MQPFSFNKCIRNSCLIAFFCCYSLFGQAQDTSFKTSRAAFQLTVIVDSESVYSQNVEAGPYVKGPNIVQIYPGERLLLEAEAENDTIKKLTPVTKNKNPERTLELSFSQVATGKKHEQMILSIKNPFKKKLNYVALMFPLNGKNWVKTSVLPIYPGISAYETWQDIIITLALMEWKLSE